MKIRTLIMTAAVSSLVATGAFAQATRTWVSGVGDDVNPCSRTAPCKTWAGAISKTAPGGEIDALDPGGFGTLNITKSLVIDGAGTMASSLNAGTNGFIINAATTDNVTLRNISINGATTGVNGVSIINAGAKNIRLDNVIIQNQPGGRCVSVTTNTGTVALVMYDVVLNNCGTNGIGVAPTGGSVFVMANRVRVEQNGTTTSHHGILMSGSASGNFTDVTVFRAAGSGLDVENGSVVSVDNCTFSRNGGDGITVQGPSAAILRLNNSTMTSNSGAGVRGVAPGAINSYKNNRSADNGLADTAATTATFY
jgi:hypothetical protein